MLDAGNVSLIQLLFIYTLNRKSTINSNENKALVLNHSEIFRGKLFKFSFDICIKIFPDVIHDTGNSIGNIHRRIQNLPYI